jgi:hypothetical protein
MADRNTIFPELALVAKCQPLELSTLLQFFRFPSSGYVRLVSPLKSGAQEPPSHRTSVQALGTTPTLTFHVEVMNG